MKKSIVLLVSLIAGLSCAIANAEDNKNELIFNACNQQDSYCPKIFFINFSNKIASFTVSQKYDLYHGDNLKESLDVKNAVLNDEEVVNNTEQFIAGYYAGDFVNTPGFRDSRYIYDTALKNYSFQINAVNGIELSNCVINRESITAPGSNDKITLIRQDDSHYICEVIQS